MFSSTRSFGYDDRGRLSQITHNGSLAYVFHYNARGERLAKQYLATPANSKYFVYDEAGRLLGEYRPDGTRYKEYVWLDDTLVAVLSNHVSSYHQYVLTDHLGTPRAVVHPGTNAILWRWDLTGSAFGDHAVQGDPDGDGTLYGLNLRYPGQYYDAETLLNYNYFRDYDPNTGRYVQSDPIGLAGGASTFSYVGANSLLFVDPRGLAYKCGSWYPHGPQRQIQTYRTVDHDVRNEHQIIPLVPASGGAGVDPQRPAPRSRTPLRLSPIGIEIETWVRTVTVTSWQRYRDTTLIQDYVKQCKWIPESDCNEKPQDDINMWDRDRVDGEHSVLIDSGVDLRTGSWVVYEWGWPL